MEVLASNLRRELAGTGIQAWGQHNIVSLYADDTLLYMEDPAATLPKAMEIFDRFGQISGLRINWSKSVLFPLGAGLSLPDGTCGLRLELEKLKYLGVYITTTPQALIQANFLDPLHTLQRKVDKWIELPLNLAGRTAIMQMVVLPKLLYIYSALPVDPGRSYFQEVKQLTSRLIWGGKHPRIAFTTTTRHYSAGGIQVPNMYAYYTAAQIQHVAHYVESTHAGEDSRIQMELHRYDPFEVGGMITNPELIPKRTPDPVSHTLHIWKRTLAKFELGHPYSPLIPITLIKGFQRALSRSDRQIWDENGLAVLGDVFQANQMLSITDIQAKLPKTTKNALRVLQLGAVLRRRWDEIPIEPVKSDLLHHILLTTGWRHQIAMLYNIIQSRAEIEPLRIKAVWEEDMGVELSEERWEEVCNHTREVARNARLGMIQYRFFTRSYMTPAILCHFLPETSLNCPGCSSPECTFLHLAWGCVDVHRFWTKVCAEMSMILGIEIPNDPKLIFLVQFPKLIPADRRLLGLALLLAKKAIAMRWMRKEPPHIATWRGLLARCNDVEDTMRLMAPVTQKPKDFWEKYRLYLFGMRESKELGER